MFLGQGSQCEECEDGEKDPAGHLIHVEAEEAEGDEEKEPGAQATALELPPGQLMGEIKSVKIGK